MKFKLVCVNTQTQWCNSTCGVECLEEEEE